MAKPPLIAVTRPVSPSLARCELTHRAREPIDAVRAAEQHGRYERLLAELGAVPVRLPAAPELPDAVFVEDTAIVLDEIAVITRPGAASRREETVAVANLLASYRPIRRIASPGTLDGGDVLRVGRTLFVGRSSRSNAAGRAQLEALTAPLGYRVIPVELEGCLHLKSAVTEVGEGLLLMNPARIEMRAFTNFEAVTVAEDEPEAANALRIGDAVVFPAHFPRTAERLAARGVRLAPVECDELAKAEGGVTCGCLLFREGGVAASTHQPLDRIAE